jgi:hypothetical protein
MASNKKESRYVRGDESLLGFRSGEDGISHINIHSVGKTELGRLLSHFAHTPFVHPYIGPFYSMEGFWYFARAGFNEKDAGKLRYLSGFRAKKIGREFALKRYDDFKEDILAANYQKIIQHEHIRELVIASELPFDHYYTFGHNHLCVSPKEASWLIQGFEDIRTALKEGVVPQLWIDAEKRYLAKK